MNKRTDICNKRSFAKTSQSYRTYCGKIVVNFILSNAPWLHWWKKTQASIEQLIFQISSSSNEIKTLAWIPSASLGCYPTNPTLDQVQIDFLNRLASDYAIETWKVLGNNVSFECQNWAHSTAHYIRICHCYTYNENIHHILIVDLITQVLNKHGFYDGPKDLRCGFISRQSE